MKVGIDARLITYRRGMGNYAYNLLAALARRDDDAHYTVFLDSEQATSAVPDDPRFTARVLAPAAYPLWEQRALPRAVAETGADVLHTLFNTAPVRPLDRTRLVMTVHDIMYLLPSSRVPRSSRLYHRLGRVYRAAVVPRAVRNAARVITISAYSREDLAEVLDLDRERIEVIHLAHDRAFTTPPDAAAADAACRRHGIAAQFLLTLGAVDPRKNTARVIDAFARFRREREGAWQLVIVGLDPAGRNRFGRFAAELGVGRDVIMTGFVPEADLVALYRTATAFVYVSLYEGFGIPIVEANATGTPVIASTSGSVPEVAADAALHVDPHDTDALVRAFARVTGDADARADLIRRGLRNSRRFSWDANAEQTVDVYRRVVST